MFERNLETIQGFYWINRLVLPVFLRPPVLMQENTTYPKVRRRSEMLRKKTSERSIEAERFKYFLECVEIFQCLKINRPRLKPLFTVHVFRAWLSTARPFEFQITVQF